MVYTSRIRGNADRRPKAFWGALIPAAINFVGGLITSSQQAKAQKRALEEQQRLAQQQLQVSNQNQLASTLNNYASAQQSYDDKDYNLKYRNGGTKRLGSNGITITDGGNARKIGNNTFLLRGGSHEDVNETGQTGIGINVGGNEIEAEGGEVAQKKNKSLRIFSAQPMLSGGLSPAQAILRGYNKDKVFTAQQRFKRNNNLNDDGSKYQNGGDIDPYSNYSTVYKNKTTRGKKLSINKGIVYLNGKKAPKGYKWFDRGNSTTYLVGSDGRFSIYQIHGKKPLERIDFNDDTYAQEANSRLELVNASPNLPLYKADAQVWKDVLAKDKLERKHIIPNRLPNVRSIKLNTKEIQTNNKGKKFSNFKGVEIPINLIDSVYKWTKEANQPLVNGFGLLGETNAGNTAPMSEDPNTKGYSNKVIRNNSGRYVSYIRPTELVNHHQFWLGPTSNLINYLIRNGKVKDNIFELGSNAINYLPTDASYIEGDKKTYDEVNNALRYIKKDTGNPNPFINALDYLKTGKYHIDKNYNNKVKERGKDFMSDKNVISRINYLRRQHRLGGGLTSKDRGSSKHPYPSVSSKDFTGDGRSYPIPTKADAIDALRLAGLHGRSDVRSKVYSKYPELRKKAKFGDWFTSLFNNNTAAPKKTVHFYKSKSGRVFNNYNEALYDNKLWNNDIVYRYNRKGDLYHKKYGLIEHNIPFQKQNAITLKNAGRASGAVISPNQLDSIAKYANRAGLSIPTAFGMVMKESTFNNPTDTKSAAKLFGLKKGTREYNKWTTGQHFQGNSSRLDKGNARDFVNFHKDDSLNPYWQNMRYVENQTRDMNKSRKMLINGEKNADRKAKAAPKLTGGKKLKVMEAAFKDYKINPYGYNPQQKDYVKLVNQNARDIMNSPQIQQWYRSSPYAKGRKYKCGGRIGARRIAKRLGGIEHARRRSALGTQSRYGFTGDGQFYYDKNRASYVDNPYYEMSGTVPEVVVTAPKKTSIDLSTTPYLGRKNTFKPATQDYIGLGIDTLAALGSGMFTRSAYNKMNFDYALPNYVDESPVAFNTIYHNEAQRANVERNRINSRNLIRGNTSSAQTALGRMQQTDTDAMMELNKLADEKANKEVELRNQNAANEQQVRARNAAARNQYYQNVAQIKNAALEAKNNAALAKAQSIGADLSGLSQAWTNFAGSVEQRYNTRQNEAIIAATSKEPAVLSNALQFGYNFSPEVLASIYRSTNDDKLKQLALSRLSPSDRRRYSLFQ